MVTTRIGLFLFLVLCICSAKADNCPSLPLKSLTCYSDYNDVINCVWNSSHVQNLTDDVCTVHAKHPKSYYKASCELKPIDASNPALKNCSMKFWRTFTFQSFHNLTLDVSCMPSKHREVIYYMPACHIKLNPPGQPNVNQTTVTWTYQVESGSRIKYFQFDLQWKQKDESWTDLPIRNKIVNCKIICNTQLEPSCNMNRIAQLDSSWFIKDETYEARVRVFFEESNLSGTWSDWSPTSSWVSEVGKTPESFVDFPTTRGFLIVAVASLFLAGVGLCTRKKQLIYVVKSFKGEPIPDPGKSEIFQDWFSLNSKGQEVTLSSKPEKSAVQMWLSSHFTGEHVQSFLSSVDIVSYEVTSTVDAMKFCRPEIKIMPESNSCDSSCSSFSNPSYSELCSSDCAPGKKLQPCAPDAPYKPAGGRGEEQDSEKESEATVKKELEMVKLLFMGDDKQKAVIISDYEKVEKQQLLQQAERFRLNSVDSGMCSCEEVSQESMEADSINTADGHDEGTKEGKQEDEEGEGGNAKKIDFQMLFGSSGNVLGKNSIQTCLDYKQIPRVQPESPVPPCQDSGVCTTAKENEEQQDSTKDEDKPSETTRFLSPHHPPGALPQQPLSTTLSSFLPPLHGNDILKQIALSGSMLRQPCSDGYMPVKQRES
ncbi:interleukin-2 receptor subunit beta-like [Poecilia latipinna]|uniref:interleukin-2 receptor subunit beta-like n=1 Tax=Poecilia latipinna TaxID=48699 RepID=UPI00072D9559|nr:PREDICTED: interleukin-2 receptor subunit beta-like [Poecilia latipinna]XP_014873560.1 PREDICTED: interleukin-2 receptor subunit beta-like [Poecilia latipinna]